jgi:hypothetical protein
MNRLEFERYINGVIGKMNTTGVINDKEIKEFEFSLNGRLPEPYRWYLQQFGSGGVPGVDVLGIGFENLNTCLECRQDYLEMGLPEDYIPIIN